LLRLLLANATSGASVRTVREAFLSDQKEGQDSTPRMLSIAEDARIRVRNDDVSDAAKAGLYHRLPERSQLWWLIRVIDGDTIAPDANVK